MLAYLSLAQYTAALEAKAARDGGRNPSIAAAVGAASAVLLSAAPFFPARAAFFETELDLQESGERWPGEMGTDFAAGEAIGRQVAADLMTRAAADGFTPSNVGVTVPVCPGCWFSAPGLLPAFPASGRCVPSYSPRPTSSARPAAGVRQRGIPDGPGGSTPDLRHPDTGAGRPGQVLGAARRIRGRPANNYLVADELIVRFHVDELRAARTPRAGGHGEHGRVHRLPRREVHLLDDPAVPGRPGDHPQRAAAELPLLSLEPCLHHRRVDGGAGRALPQRGGPAQRSGGRSGRCRECWEEFTTGSTATSGSRWGAPWRPGH